MSIRVDDPSQDDQQFAFAEASSGRASSGRAPAHASESLMRPSRTTLVLAVVVAVGCILIGAAIAGSIDTQHAAELEILNDYSDLDGPAAERRQETQIALVRSRAVLAPVSEATGISVEELDDHLEVELVGASEVLRLRALHADPDQALAIVDAAGDAYLAATPETEEQQGNLEEARELVAERLAALDERRETIEARLAELQEEQAARQEAELPVTTSNEVDRLQLELQELLRRSGELQAVQLQQEFEEVEERPAPARLLTDAYLLDDPIGPRPLQGAAFGLGIGLVLAAAILAVRGLLSSPSTHGERGTPDGA